jgi:adenosylhomocysteine nucleosidase
MRKRLVALLLALVLVLSMTTGAFASESGPRPIVIQGAMDIEVMDMVAALKDAKEITYGSWTFWSGTLEDYPVIVSRTEVGITNAAAATAIAIEKFNPCLIINQGTSGGHDPALHRYDIVLGKLSVNYGKFRSEHGDLGQGIQPEKWIPDNVSLRVDGEKVYFDGFKGDQEVFEIAERLAPSYEHGKVVVGVIGTADEWNRELDRIQWVHETYDSSVEEMETASSAQVAEAYKIPFLGIRILSNSEWHGEEFDPKSASYCQEYTLEVVKAYINEKLQTSPAEQALPGIYFNDEAISLSTRPIIDKGVIYLPVRELIIKLGGTISWDAENNVAKATINDQEILLSSQDADLFQNGVIYIAADKLGQITDYKVAILGLNQVRIFQ